MDTIVWPGTTFELRIADAGHVALYKDLVAKGRRLVVGPLARWSEESRLHATAPLLTLDEIKLVQDIGDGATYVARHSVLGRARISRVLNPSVIYSQGAGNVECLRAEVDALPDDEPPLVSTVARECPEALVAALEEVRALSERLGEPRLQSEKVVRQRAQTSSTWYLADLWQRLRLQLRTHRYRASVRVAVKEWVEGQRRQGRKHEDLDAATMPQALAAAAQRSQLQPAQADGTDGSDFWEASGLLQVLACSSYEKRYALLAEMALEEARASRTRISLRNLLG